MKRRYFLFGLSTMVLIGCNQRPPVSKFVGQWKSENKLVYEFTEKGGFQIKNENLKPVSEQYTWEFKDDKHLLLAGEIKAFRFEGDDVLVWGAPPKEQKYTKVK